MSADHLFSVEPVAALEEGAEVVVQTIWGDLPCRVVGHERRDGFPMVKVQRQDRHEVDPFVVDVARVRSVGLQPRLEGL